jgi:hypothetical protein
MPQRDLSSISLLNNLRSLSLLVYKVISSPADKVALWERAVLFAGVFQYRIKSVKEFHERVVQEQELRSAAGDA